MTETSENLAEKLNQQPAVTLKRSDTLSEVLDIIHVHGEQALVIAPDGPQTISFQDAMPCLHIVEHGDISIRVEGLPDPVKVGANQLALLLQGHAHEVDYGGGGNPAPIAAAMAKSRMPDALQYGTSNTTRCFWGSFSFYGDLAESVLRGVPPVIVISDLKQNPIDWLDMSCQIILDETRSERPGANVMVSRLLDLMLVQILRRWAKEAETAPGWLASATDERISRATTAIHENVAHNWDIEALAHLCGMSRSSFVAQFEKVMKQAPGAYLRELRLAKAAQLLRYSGATIETISEQVGYKSKEAFSRAFRKRFETSPSAWRSVQ